MSTTRPNPQAFATGTYPAGAGGSLTGVGPDVGADIGGLNLAFARIDSPTSPNFGGSQVADEFDSATGIGSLGSGVVGGGYLSNPGGYSQYTPTGSTFGDMTSGGGLAGAFNGNTNQASGASAYKTPGPGYVGKAFASAQAISKVVVYSLTNNANGVWTQSGASASVTISVYGKASSPASGTDGTLLSTTTFTDPTTAESRTLTFTAASYQYIWVYVSASTYAVNASQVQYFTNIAPASITTVSNAYTAASVPTQATIVAEWQDVSTTAVLNTDITFEVSRDGGTTWTVVTMTSLGASLVSGAIAIKGSVDISGQPSGTSMKWRIKTFNTKEQRVHGVWLQWK